MYVAGMTSSSRVTGMVSGMDVDTTVQNLMEAETYKYDAVYQKKVLDEWRMDAYREVNTELTAFKDKYFNYLSSSSNMLSSSSLATFETTVSDSEAFIVTAKTGAASGSHTVEILQLATAAIATGTLGISAAITGTSAVDYDSLEDLTLTMTLDGEDRTLEFRSGVTSVSDLQTQIDDTWGTGKVTVSEEDGKLSFSVVNDSGVYEMSLSGGTALEALGFEDVTSVSNRLDTSKTLADLAASMESPFTFNGDDELVFEISGSTFTFDSADTLEDVMDTINDSEVGVTFSYDNEADRLIFTADDTGAGQTFTLTEEDSTFLSAFGLEKVTAGLDSISEIDGKKYTRSSNALELDGITYSFKTTTEEEESATVTYDSDAAVELITGFVTDYNSLVESLRSKYTAEYDSDYPPLTEAQEEEMTDTEIESWNESAKKGLLENDSLIGGLLSDLCSLLYNNVDGCDCTLYTIGITTSSYDENGTLTVDSDALKEALEEDPESVLTLFTQRSDTYGSISARKLSSTERAVRKDESGLMWNMFDALEDRISTVTTVNGTKGLLLEKAGKSGDASCTDNTLYTSISKYEAELEDLEDYLTDREDYYYERFTAMESYISEMNAQLSAFQSSFSS